MQHLKANTQVIVTIGPFVDVGDGFTPETGITLGAADEAELLKHGSTTVVDISAATWAAVTNLDGYYSLTLTTSHTDTEGMLGVYINDDSVCLPVKSEFMVLSEAAYDSLYAAKDAGFMDVNIKTVGRADATETQADNLESACGNYSVTRGLSGTALPAVVAGANNGLPLGDANARVDVGSWLGTAVTNSTTTNKPEVDVNSISDDATAANNLELMYDGTGYTDDTAPSSRAQVDGTGASSGGSVNIEATEDNTGGAIKTVTFVGSVQSGTFASTEAEDGTLHDIDDTANDIDIVYGFDVGGSRQATSVSFAGFVQGASDQMQIEVYDFIGTDWEIIGTIVGTNGTNNTALELPLLSKHTGTGTDLGKVYIRFDTNSTTPSNLSVDKLIVSAVNTGQSIGYVDGAVWIDTAGSNTNTESFVDGTADNPVSTIAAAKTIADNLNLKRFHLLPDSSITLAATMDGFEFDGQNYTIALGSQSIDGCTFSNAIITGIGEATTTQPTFHCCSIGAATIPPAVLRWCGIGRSSGTFTAAVGSGEYVFHNCFSVVPGSGSPTFDFSPVTGSSGINNRGWFGGAIYTLDTNCALSHEVIGGGGLSITPADADVEIRGLCRSLTIALSDTDVGNTIQAIAHVGPVTITASGTLDSATINLHGTKTSISDGSSGGTTVTDEMMTNDSIADQVWLETLADHSGSSGSTAEALNAAGAAGDPWTTALPGAYGAGSAGKIVGDNLDSPVSTVQADLDTITGTDGATLATAQGNYAPNTTVPLAADKMLAYFQLMMRSDSAINTDRSTELGEINANEGTGAGDYANTSDSAEAIRDKQTDIEGDTQDIQSRLPAALVGGNMASDVQAMQSDTVTANAIANGAIDANTFAAGAIDATAIATGAIDADALAADAVAEILTTQMTESYHADGSAPTVAQALCFLIAAMTEFSISGTTITAKKLDGSTTAATFTLDNDTNPTSRTRAT